MVLEKKKCDRAYSGQRLELSRERDFDGDAHFSSEVVTELNFDQLLHKKTRKGRGVCVCVCVCVCE